MGGHTEGGWGLPPDTREERSRARGGALAAPTRAAACARRHGTATLLRTRQLGVVLAEDAAQCAVVYRLGAGGRACSVCEERRERDASWGEGMGCRCALLAARTCCMSGGCTRACAATRAAPARGRPGAAPARATLASTLRGVPLSMYTISLRFCGAARAWKREGLQKGGWGGPDACRRRDAVPARRGCQGSASNSSSCPLAQPCNWTSLPQTSACNRGPSQNNSACDYLVAAKWPVELRARLQYVQPAGGTAPHAHPCQGTLLACTRSRARWVDSIHSTACPLGLRVTGSSTTWACRQRRAAEVAGNEGYRKCSDGSRPDKWRAALAAPDGRQAAAAGCCGLQRGPEGSARSGRCPVPAHLLRVPKLREGLHKLRLPHRRGHARQPHAARLWRGVPCAGAGSGAARRAAAGATPLAGRPRPLSRQQQAVGRDGRLGQAGVLQRAAGRRHASHSMRAKLERYCGAMPVTKGRASTCLLPGLRQAA